MNQDDIEGRLRRDAQTWRSPEQLSSSSPDRALAAIQRRGADGPRRNRRRASSVLAVAAVVVVIAVAAVGSKGNDTGTASHPTGPSASEHQTPGSSGIEPASSTPTPPTSPSAATATSSPTMKTASSFSSITSAAPVIRDYKGVPTNAAALATDTAAPGVYRSNPDFGAAWTDQHQLAITIWGGVYDCYPLVSSVTVSSPQHLIVYFEVAGVGLSSTHTPSTLPMCTGDMGPHTTVLSAPRGIDSAKPVDLEYSGKHLTLPADLGAATPPAVAPDTSSTTSTPTGLVPPSRAPGSTKTGAGQPDGKPKDIEGATWLLERAVVGGTVYNSPQPPGSSFSASYTVQIVDGRFVANDSCNTLEMGVTVGPRTVTTSGGQVSTAAACLQSALREAYDRELFEATLGWVVSAGQLTLTTPGGDTFAFELLPKHAAPPSTG